MDKQALLLWVNVCLEMAEENVQGFSKTGEDNLRYS